uniref:MSP domain-containing protein n=1 Tax=Parascaris equorum TaxID=6256 RepID=A0A914RIB3_PAREQ
MTYCSINSKSRSSGSSRSGRRLPNSAHRARPAMSDFILKLEPNEKIVFTGKVGEEAVPTTLKITNTTQCANTSYAS